MSCGSVSATTGARGELIKGAQHLASLHIRLRLKPVNSSRDAASGGVQQQLSDQVNVVCCDVNAAGSLY